MRSDIIRGLKIIYLKRIKYLLIGAESIDSKARADSPKFRKIVFDSNMNLNQTCTLLQNVQIYQHIAMKSVYSAK